MERILVLQSYRDHDAAGWVGKCIDSVRHWCELHHYAYAYCGDELFERVPGWYMEKVGARTPILADLARLIWIREELRTGGVDVVAWLDADTLILQPVELEIRFASSCVFGREIWVQAGAGKERYQVHRNVHNAYCAFRPECPILPFLIEAVQRMVRRVDAAHMAPQFVGPKLLTHLHNTVGFELDARFGALSPEMIEALLRQQHGPLQTLRQAMPGPLQAVNLCASLQVENRRMHDVIHLLLKAGGLEMN